MCARACAALLGALIVACTGTRPVDPVTARHYRARIDSALRAGDPEQAAETLRRARRAFPDDPNLLMSSAILEQMRWREIRALNDLREIQQRGDYGELGREEVMGSIGDLLFFNGSYAESRSFLSAGDVGPHAVRRRALAQLSRDLPHHRREPLQLAAELPLSVGSLPELSCSIGDKRRSFVLDTGASFTTLTKTLARELEVSAIVGAGSGQDGAGREFDVWFGVLSNFVLGSVELGDLPVLVVEDEDLALRDPFASAIVAPSGVVGLDVLARFRITFDPQRKSVVFELPRGLDPLESVECVQYDGRCLVPISIEGRRLWFILDTGASHSSLTTQGLVALPGGVRRTVEAFRRVRTPGGTQHAVRQVPDLPITIGTVRFTGVDLPIVQRPAFGTFPIHGVLGADLLLRCRTTFDRGRVRLQTLDG